MSESFYQRVYRLLATVPPGRVATYGQLAALLGRPSGGRLVGWAMRYCPEDVPWHRVVNNQGQLRVTATLPDGKLMQQALLEEEGVVFDSPGQVRLDLYGWAGPGCG